MSEEFTIAEFKHILDQLPEHYLVHFETNREQVLQFTHVELDSLFQTIDFIFEEVENGQ